MNAGSALSFCLRMHQVIRPVVKLKPMRHSFPPSFLHSIYFLFFFSVSVTISVTYRYWFHLPLSSNPLFLTQPYLITCKYNISKVIIHGDQISSFFPCLRYEIDCLYQNVYSQTFIEQNQERNTGRVKFMRSLVFFLLSEQFAFITATDNPIIVQEFDIYLM